MSDVAQLRPGISAPAESVTLRDTFAEACARFKERFGHSPVVAAWVLMDEGRQQHHRLGDTRSSASPNASLRRRSPDIRGRHLRRLNASA